MKLYTSLVINLFFSSFFSACSSSTDDSVPTGREEYILATVGDRTITAAHLKEFSKPIPAGMKQGDTPLEINRNLLGSLIDKELLLLEARHTGIATDPWFNARLSRRRQASLLRLFYQREVDSKIQLTENEIVQRYRATGRDRALRFSAIVLKTREEALQIWEQLYRDGADFHQLAVERSVDRETGERGGDVGGYARKDEVAKPMAESLFHLPVGALSAPIPQQVAGEPHYVVFKIMDEKPVPLEETRNLIEQELWKEKQQAIVESLLDSLNRKYLPRIDGEAAQWLIEFVRQSTGEEEELPQSVRDRSLFTYQDGQLTLGEFWQVHQPALTGGQRDSAYVLKIIEQVAIPQHLLIEGAHGLRLHETPEFTADLERNREELLLDALRRREVDRHIEVSEAEARAFYENNPEKFTLPETLLIGEVLVADQPQAHQVRERLEAGADVQKLAKELTLRPRSAQHNGRIRLNILTRHLLPEIYDLASQLEIGEIGGPLSVRGGYSVFKVLERQQPVLTYDAEARRRAIAYVKVDKAAREYVHYVRGMRNKYPVEIFEHNLAKLDPADAATAN